ncbi:MAG: phage holin family protein [Alistipes sp.]|nr:phage holin family protein [Alistipes sp.]MBQ3246775.1 phage holin family protein [Alistipes sp.]
METLSRLFNMALIGTLSLFAPIAPLVGCAVTFVAVDFVTGVAASRARAHAQGEEWFFESHEAWHTVLKLGFVVVAIAMSWLVERFVLDFVTLNLAKMFTGFTCAVEFWSFLENASQLSDSPIFVWLKRYARRRIRKEVDGE